MPFSGSHKLRLSGFRRANHHWNAIFSYFFANFIAFYSPAERLDIETSNFPTVRSMHPLSTIVEDL